MRVVMVCLGNICRSPMAEMIAKKYASEMGLPLEVTSAGVAVWKGTSMNSLAVEALKRLGVPVHPHKSRPLTRELVEWADKIYVMEKKILDYCVRSFPDSAEKFEMLADEDIEDPYGGDLDDYIFTAKRIEDAIREKLKGLGFEFR